MLVDRREMGGERAGLGEVVFLLNLLKVASQKNLLKQSVGEMIHWSFSKVTKNVLKWFLENVL